MRKLVHLSMVAFAALLLVVHDADAQRRGGGGRGGGGFRGGGGGFRGGGGGGRGGGFSMGARSSARSSVTSRPSRSSFGGGDRSFNRGVDRTPRVDRVDRTPRVDRGDFNRGNFDGNINIDRDITIDNDNGGWWDRDYFGCCDHPVAATAALGAAAAYGYAAGSVGTYYNTLPYYSGCTESVVNGVVYWDCANNWYQPTFSGIDAAYVAVTPPQ